MMPLTEQQAATVRHLVDGLTNKQIAAAMSRSPDTIRDHVRSAMRKMGAKNRVQVAVKAVRSGIA
jgi:DNA-binding NarL/FixJ family response regulator